MSAWRRPVLLLCFLLLAAFAASEFIEISGIDNAHCRKGVSLDLLVGQSRVACSCRRQGRCDCEDWSCHSLHDIALPTPFLAL